MVVKGFFKKNTSGNSCRLPEDSITTTVVIPTTRGSPGVTPLTVKLAGSTVKCLPVGIPLDQVVI